MPDQEAVGYWYIHTDGSIHFKPERVVDMGGGPGEYFTGPFVKRWWYGKFQDGAARAVK
jgi:hypothetical protein